MKWKRRREKVLRLIQSVTVQKCGRMSTAVNVHAISWICDGINHRKRRNCQRISLIGQMKQMKLSSCAFDASKTLFINVDEVFFRVLFKLCPFLVFPLSFCSAFYRFSMLFFGTQQTDKVNWERGDSRTRKLNRTINGKMLCPSAMTYWANEHGNN